MTDNISVAGQRNQGLVFQGQMADMVLSVQAVFSDFIVGVTIWPVRAFSAMTAKPAKPATAKVNRSSATLFRHLPASRSLPTGSATGSDGDATLPESPEDTQHLTRRHRSAAGSRGYQLYVPAGRRGRPKGLILMLHGCNQTPDDFATGTNMNCLADKHGLALAYPAQTTRQNPGSCWNWFKPRNQTRGTGEPAILAALTRSLMREFGLGRDDVFVAGLSAGGAMAAILADLYPDVFAAAGVHSGLARGAAWDTLSAMSAMSHGGVPNTIAARVTKRAGPVRRIIFHGEDDRTVNPLNAGYIVAAELGRDVVSTKVRKRSVRGRDYSCSLFSNSAGAVLIELWMIVGSGHAWSGGRAAGSYTDTKGPDASAQMVRFFLDKPE